MTRPYVVPEPRPGVKFRDRPRGEIVVPPSLYNQGDGPRLSWRDADLLIVLIDRVAGRQPNPTELARIRSKLERGRV